MGHDFRIIKNAMPLDLLVAVKKHANTQQYIRTNHTCWHSSIVELSGPIYVVDIPEELQQEIKTSLCKSVPDFNLSAFEAAMHVSMGGRYSYIPWHTDGDYVYSATIYLNEHWDKEWAGYFMYETEAGNIEAICPEFNKAIIFKTPVAHCVTMPNVHAPIRYAIQVFFKQNVQEAVN